MYLSKGHMLYTAVMAAFQLFVGLPFTFILLLMGLFDPSYFRDDMDGFLPFLLEFGFITYLGIRNICNFVHASKYNRTFEVSGFGSLTVTQTAGKLGISDTVCRKRFDRLTRYGLLKHCHFECENDTRFVLHKKQTDDFRGVVTIILHVIAFFGIGLSGFMLFIFIFGILSELISGGVEYMDEPGVVFMITLLFAAMMAGCLKIRNVIGRAYRFSNYFSGNAGRIVHAMQLARAHVVAEETVVKEFGKLSRWGLLTGWTLIHGPTPHFRPHNMVKPVPPQPAVVPPVQQTPDYETVNCPNCGASLCLEVGKVEQCPYCDSWLEV